MALRRQSPGRRAASRATSPGAGGALEATGVVDGAVDGAVAEAGRGVAVAVTAAIVPILTVGSSRFGAARARSGEVSHGPVGHDGPMPDAVFVYGTLMPGRLRWPMLAPFAVEQTETTATGWLWDTGNGWPAARFSTVVDAAPLPAPVADASAVPGWRIAWAPADRHRLLAALDDVEGPPYRRVVVATDAGEAWTYECRTIGSTWIPIAGWAEQPDR